MDRCPACRARLGEAPVCPRCGCDFTLARRAEAQAQRLACRAIRAWAEGNGAVASARISESLSAKNTGLAEAVSEMLCRGGQSKEGLR